MDSFDITQIHRIIDYAVDSVFAEIDNRTPQRETFDPKAVRELLKIVDSTASLIRNHFGYENTASAIAEYAEKVKASERKP